MTTTPAEALAAIRQSHRDSLEVVAQLEGAVAEEIARDKASRLQHTNTMRELRPALAAARAAEAGWKAMLPRERTTATTPPADYPLTLVQEG